MLERFDLELVDSEGVPMGDRQGVAHWYRDLDGVILPSSTTIIRATQHPDDAAGLERWRERIGRAEAEAITLAASVRGLGLHNAIESYLLTGIAVVSEEAEPYWESFKQDLHRLSNPLLFEASIWHPLRFAGRPDYLGNFDDTLVIADWKTSDKAKVDQWIGDYFIQVASYAAGVNWVYKGQVKVRNAVVIVARPKRKPQVFWLGPDTLYRWWCIFKDRLEMFKRMENK